MILVSFSVPASGTRVAADAEFFAGILAALIAGALLGVITWIAILPRLDWGASQRPSGIEQALARNVLIRWIKRNADNNANPFTPTSTNLKAAQAEYEEHCAACHGLDGSARNGLEADFYPPVAKLTGDVQKFSDPNSISSWIKESAIPRCRGLESTTHPATFGAQCCGYAISRISGRARRQISNIGFNPPQTGTKGRWSMAWVPVHNPNDYRFQSLA
jgi:hypothetical protein